MPACSPNLVADINHLERILRLAIKFVTSMRHLPYEERLQRLGLHSLQRRQLLADLITAFKIFKGLLDIDPNLFFLPPARRGLRGHSFMVLQGASHRRRRGSAFSVRVVKYSCFQEKAGESLDSSISPLLTEHSLPSAPFPHPTCTPSIYSYRLYMLPNSLFYICGFFRPVVAYFLLL